MNLKEENVLGSAPRISPVKDRSENYFRSMRLPICESDFALIRIKSQDLCISRAVREIQLCL